MSNPPRLRVPLGAAGGGPAGALCPATHDQPGGTMTTSVPATPFTDPAPVERMGRAAAALAAKNFAVAILDAAAPPRTPTKDLIPHGARLFTGATETLHPSGTQEDINKP